MSSEVMGKILQTIESEVRSRPSAMEYEMAYQARIAIDRIRFAIKQTEQFARHSDQAREASFQLVDALDRLETADWWLQRDIVRTPGQAARGHRRRGQGRLPGRARLIGTARLSRCGGIRGIHGFIASDIRFQVRIVRIALQLLLQLALGLGRMNGWRRLVIFRVVHRRLSVA